MEDPNKVLDDRVKLQAIIEYPLHTMATVDNNSAFDQFVQFWSKTNRKGQNAMHIAALPGFWNVMDSLLQCSPHPERLFAPASSDN